MATQLTATPPAVDRVVTDADAAFFARQGFVLPARGLDAASTARMVDDVEAVFRDNPDWHNLVRMPHVPLRSGQLEGVIGGERLFDIAIHPTVIAAAQALIGDDLILWGGEIFAKPPGIGKATPWHQDCYNPAIKPEPGRKLARSVMIWIAVDDVDVENGCLRFVPGSGQGGRLEHSLGSKANVLLDFEVEGQGVDFGTAVDAIRPSGMFSAHDLFVVHGANANTSGRRRAGITFHYMNAADAYDRSFGSATGSGASGKPAPLAQRPIWLVLGENRNPINDFTIGHQQLADLDARAEARRLEMNAALLR